MALIKMAMEVSQRRWHQRGREPPLPELSRYGQPLP